jgi:phosphoribosylanthranilate isomerase
MTRVKICGMTQGEDARWAAQCGADAIGVIFYAASPRRVTEEQAREVIRAVDRRVTVVGLFVDAPVDEMLRVCGNLGITTVQLQGDETPETVERLRPLTVIKGVRVGSAADMEDMERYGADAYLLDAKVAGHKGGTGKRFDWVLAQEPARRLRVIVAGGLTPENVAEAVRVVQPYGVDVCSGVEASPGRKDPEKVREFVRRARSEGSLPSIGR